MSGRRIGAVSGLGDLFVPATREIAIGRGVVYRPLRSWHSGVLAGEGITRVSGDGSGCLKEHPGRDDYYVAPQPSTYTHRWYWNKSQPERRVSAFLSYPRGMGSLDEYFWEANIGEVDRWTGEDAEERMEEAIRREIGDGPMVDAPATARCEDG